jgi:hypothetical protein
MLRLAIRRGLETTYIDATGRIILKQTRVPMEPSNFNQGMECLDDG